jgi:hypothetical protein
MAKTVDRLLLFRDRFAATVGKEVFFPCLKLNVSHERTVADVVARTAQRDTVTCYAVKVVYLPPPAVFFERPFTVRANICVFVVNLPPTFMVACSFYICYHCPIPASWC